MASQRSSKKSGRGWIILVSVLLILGAVFAIFLSLRKKKAIQEPSPESDEPESLSPEARIKQFYSLVKQVFFDETLARFVTAQAMHETGVFTSPLYLQNNNAFGMKEPLKRPSTDLNYDEKGYAEYENVEESIIDLSEWMTFVQFDQNVDTIQKYAQELKAHDYYTDTYSKYLGALKKHLTVVQALL